MTEKRKKLNSIKCDTCGYSNHNEYVLYSGICHGCGKVLNGRARFRYIMNRKLKIWRDDRPDVWGHRANKFCNRQIKGIKNKS